MRSQPGRLGRVALWASALLVGCAAPPQTDPDVGDATAFAVRAFEDPEAELAFGIRVLEDSLLDLPLASSEPADRALTPPLLTEDDLAGLERPDVDPEQGIGVLVAGASAPPPSAHATWQLLPDQSPLLTNAPEGSERTFVDGADCWVDQECPFLRTDNRYTRVEDFFTFPVHLGKDLRWVDLDLPDPSTVPEGEPVVNPGAPRHAIVARSWLVDSVSEDGGSESLHFQYSLELWIPRDGGSLLALSLWYLLDGHPITGDPELQRGRTISGTQETFELWEAWLDGE